MNKRVSIEEQLLKAQTVINNSLEDPEILTSVSVYGYNETKLNTGKGLLDEVNALLQKQRKEYGEQFEATSEVNKARAKADAAYMKTLTQDRDFSPQV